MGEKASKGQDSREINKTSGNSRAKTKSGEYVLNQSPKKPGGEEAYDINTAIIITCVIASTYEKSSQTITDMLKMGRCQVLCEWKRKMVIP